MQIFPTPVCLHKSFCRYLHKFGSYLRKKRVHRWSLLATISNDQLRWQISAKTNTKDAFSSNKKVALKTSSAHNRPDDKVEPIELCMRHKMIYLLVADLKKISSDSYHFDIFLWPSSSANPMHTYTLLYVSNFCWWCFFMKQKKTATA